MIPLRVGWVSSLSKLAWTCCDPGWSDLGDIARGDSISVGVGIGVWLVLRWAGPDWRDSPLLMFINHLLVLVCSWQHLLFLSPHVEQGRLLEELRELESLRTSSGGAGVGAAGASANIGAGSIIPVLGGLGLVGVAAGNRCCVWQQASLALCGQHCWTPPTS